MLDVYISFFDVLFIIYSILSFNNVLINDKVEGVEQKKEITTQEKLNWALNHI